MYEFHIVELKTFCNHTSNTAKEQWNDVRTDAKGDRAEASHNQGCMSKAQ